MSIVKYGLCAWEANKRFIDIKHKTPTTRGSSLASCHVWNGGPNESHLGREVDELGELDTVALITL